VDATGYQANAVSIRKPLPENGLIMGIYGGNMATYGLPRDSLVFPPRDMMDNHWGWAMPIGANTAEVVVAEMIRRKDQDRWRNRRAENAFENAIKIYGEHGIGLFPKKTSMHHMGFAVQPLPKKYYEGQVIPFGEAEGLNDPLNGQLINRVQQDAKTLAGIIENGDFRRVGTDYYKTKLGHAAANVLLHRVFAEGRRLGIKINNQSAVGLLGDQIKDVFPDKLWEIQMGGRVSGQIIKELILQRPIEIAQVALLSAPVLMKLFFTENQLFRNLIPFKP
jgi:hypothetical protein